MTKALETLAKRVKEKRETLGYSQKELARRCEISTQTVSNIENALKGVDFKTIANLAFVLKCEETDLFSTNIRIPPSVEKVEIPKAQWEILVSKFQPLTMSPLPKAIMDKLSSIPSSNHDAIIDLLNVILNEKEEKLSPLLLLIQGFIRLPDDAKGSILRQVKLELEDNTDQGPVKLGAASPQQTLPPKYQEFMSLLAALNDSQRRSILALTPREWLIYASKIEESVRIRDSKIDIKKKKAE